LLASDPSSGGPIGGGNPPFGSGIGYSFTNWPAAQLQGISLRTENTLPIVGPKGQAVRAPEDWIIRDPFPVTDLDGQITQVGGWYVMAGLATPRDDSVGTLREFGYVISRDGIVWQEGGTMISTATPGIIPADYRNASDPTANQLFSGDFRYDAATNTMHLYYTAVEGNGTPDNPYPQSPSGIQIPQEIAYASAVPVPTANGLDFAITATPGVILQPDGAWYAKPEEANTETEVYGFRDPWIFRDPESRNTYMLFVGNWGSDQTIGYPPGATTGDQAFPDAGPTNVDPGRPRNDGVAGIAVSRNGSMTDWELLPPVFGAIGVNTQLELPHFVYKDGHYYLFVTTHNRTFIGDLKYDYPEGLYGFVADDLQGPYRPLNDTSLVFANPPEEPLQNYGWKVVATGGDYAEAFSFINKGDSGTISPAVRLTLDGDRAFISGMQPPSGVSQQLVPGLPLIFGAYETRPRNAPTLAAVGRLDPSSDSGASDSDGITSVTRPLFTGEAPAGYTLRLLVAPEGPGPELSPLTRDRIASATAIGETTVAPDGSWRLTPASDLPEGRHRVIGIARAPGQPELLADLGRVVIDTTAPRMVPTSFAPGQSRVTFRLTDGLSGIHAPSRGGVQLASAAGQIGAASLHGSRTRQVNVLGSQIRSGPDGSGQLDVLLRRGRRYGDGTYAFNVPGSLVADLAGNQAADSQSFWRVRQGAARSFTPSIAPPRLTGEAAALAQALDQDSGGLLRIRRRGRRA
jgi:levansucrase